MSDEFPAVNALRDAIATRRHAEMLFGMVVDLLGEEAVLETRNHEQTRILYRREGPKSRWVIPWPLLTVERGGREGPSPIRTAVPGVFIEPPRRPGVAPRLRDLGPGRIALQDGPHEITLSFGADGRWFECTRSRDPEALEDVVGALAAQTGPPVELVASFLAGLDIGRHGPARVRMPVDLPGGPPAVWLAGLYGLREALFHERVPRAARWVAVDGWTGRALAWGATREAAMTALEAEIARVRPFPAKPEPPEAYPEPSIETSFEDGKFAMWGTIVGPRSDTPWVEPTVENSPAALISLGDLPSTPPALGEWTWLLDRFGGAVPYGLRLEKGGFTLVGDRVPVDPAGFEKALAAAEKEEIRLDASGIPPEFLAQRPVPDYHLRTYRFLHEKTGAPTKPAVTGQQRGRGFRPVNLDGGELRGSVLRMRPPA